MRMSLSRFAAFGLALMAGVTLASCASSGAIFPATGPNPAAPSFPAARVRFIQGSPNLNLGITTVDLYIDGKFAGTFFYGSVTPDIYSLPTGPHDFKLVQTGTLFPVFLEQTFVLTGGTKYAVVAAGDASNHSTKFMLFIEPKYSTPTGNAFVSVFNASPRAGTVDFLANGFDLSTDTIVGLGVSVGSPAAPPASWKINVAILPPGPEMCISAYHTGTTTPLVGGWPSIVSDEHNNTACTATLPLPNPAPPALPAPNLNLYLIDFGPSPATTSLLVTTSDQNG